MFCLKFYWEYQHSLEVVFAPPQPPHPPTPLKIERHTEVAQVNDYQVPFL